MPLVHRVAIVSEKGEVKGFLRVAVQAISGVWGDTGVCGLESLGAGESAFTGKGGRNNIMQELI